MRCLERPCRVRHSDAALGITFVPSPTASIGLSVDELQGTTIAQLISPGSFSWLAVPFLAAPLVWIVARRRTGGIRARLGPAPALLAWLSAGLIAGTLLFSRNKIVLAPLAAVVIGGLFEALAPTGPAGGEARPRLRRPRSRDRGAGAGSVARSAGRVLVVACILATAKDAVSLALTRESRLDPGQRSALEFLARATPPEAVVLAPWDRGYEIQAYAGRKTVLDGLLEDPLNQRRIIGIAGPGSPRAPTRWRRGASAPGRTISWCPRARPCTGSLRSPTGPRPGRPAPGSP